jgi:hypothetical protein
MPPRVMLPSPDARAAPEIAIQRRAFKLPGPGAKDRHSAD